MEEQSHSLIRRTRFCQSVYQQNQRGLEASRLQDAIPFPFTLQPRRIPATVKSGTTATNQVSQTPQTVSPISEPTDSENLNEAGSKPRKEQKKKKKRYFGKLLHKHSGNTKITTSSPSGSQSPSHVSTFLEYVKSLIFRKPSMER